MLTPHLRFWWGAAPPDPHRSDRAEDVGRYLRKSTNQPHTHSIYREKVKFGRNPDFHMDSDLGKAGRWSVLGDDVTGKGFVKKKEPTNVEGTSCDTEAAWPWPWRYHKSGTDSSNTCATLASGAGLEITAPKKSVGSRKKVRPTSPPPPLRSQLLPRVAFCSCFQPLKEHAAAFAAFSTGTRPGW